MTPELKPGARLGQYQIVDHLGAGGMGTVYLAADTKLGRQVALKLLHPKMLEDGTAGIARFEREARALAALNHPRVAAMHRLKLEHPAAHPALIGEQKKPVSARDLRVACFASAQRAALGEQVRSRGAMNRAIHAAAAQKRRVRGVDDGVQR